MKALLLIDKITPVPKNISVYKNKIKFSSSLLSKVDTTVVYEEFDRDRNILMRADNCISCRGYSIYKFYPNGCFNAFFFGRNSTLPVNEFDPLYTGYRGVYYTENNKIRFDLFAEIDERQHIGKITGTLTFSGDTLYVKQDDRKGIDAMKYPTEIYVKRKLSPEYFVYKANW
jgi:hypothetical protein